MKKILFALASFALVLNMSAAQPFKLKVWPDGAPNSNGATQEKPASNNQKWDFEPEITVVLADNPNGVAVLCMPGGGYSVLSNTHEGIQYAEWFNSIGVSFIMVDYRMPGGHKEVPLSDVQQAMRIIHEHSEEWKITKLGVLGSSAGGHLASTAATHYVDDVTKPAFQILFYPVITMKKGITHQSSCDLLLGQNPSQEDLDLFSNELQVTRETPMAFIIHSTDDRLVPVENSILYYQALVKNGVKATMHIYPNGGHGYGAGTRFRYAEQWRAEVARWIEMEVNR